MQKIALMTDSACDLDQATIARYGIRVLPLTVVFGERQYRDGIDITPEEVYARITEYPTTSLPTPGQTKELFESIAKEGFTHVLAVHLSSGLSGTYEMVRMVSREIHNLTIEVIDTKILALGLGLIVRQTARWIEQKLDFNEIIRRVHEISPKVKGFFTLKTLEYLKRGGRIGTVQATIGEILDLKPVVSINEHGKYFSYAKARGRAKSLEKIYEIAAEFLEQGKATIAVLQGDAIEEARAIYDRIKKIPNAAEVLFSSISPALVVHTGPGLVGLIVMPEK